jgi:hypothetical protein
MLGGGGHLAILSGTSVSPSAIFAGLPGALRRVVQRDEPAPGAGPGVTVGELLFPTVNAAGQVAFITRLEGAGVPPSDGEALYATDAAGTLRLIARENAPFDVGNGTFPTLLRLEFRGDIENLGAGQDGLQTMLNDNGTLVFAASFSDGTSGIFTATVPEPASLSLLCFASVWLLRRRHRRAQNPVRPE